MRRFRLIDQGLPGQILQTNPGRAIGQIHPKVDDEKGIPLNEHLFLREHRRNQCADKDCREADEKKGGHGANRKVFKYVFKKWFHFYLPRKNPFKVEVEEKLCHIEKR